MNIEEFRSLLCISKNEQTGNIEERFKEIADFLMKECSIEYKGVHYQFIDLEFYFFNDNHKDISVHPRQSHALTWYINDFGGIDLNFESKIDKVKTIKNNKISYKYNLTKDSYFGGILLRQLKNLSTGEILDGPWKVADLFREQDAVSHVHQNPIIIMEHHDVTEIKASARLNLLGASKDARKKAEYNKNSCFAGSYLDIETLASELVEFNKKAYRFTTGK